MAAPLKVARTVAPGNFKRMPDDWADEKPVDVLEAESRPEEKHSYIPDKSYAQKYVGRTVNGVEDFKLLQFCMDNRMNLLLRGPTGSGKTMFPMAWAAKTGKNFYAVPCDVSMEPSALFGQMIPDGNGSFMWQDGPVTELTRYGGVLCISEANFMSPKIAASLFPLLDHRRELPLLRHRGEIVKAHDELLVVTDYNPGYRGTMPVNEAFLNRFQVKQEWGYNDAVEDKLVKSKALLEMARKIRESTGIKTPVSTNSMMEFVRIAVHLGYSFAEQNFNSMFEANERQALKMIVDVHSTALKSQIASIARRELGAADDTVIKDQDFDPDWKVPAGATASDFEFEDD